MKQLYRVLLVTFFILCCSTHFLKAQNDVDVNTTDSVKVKENNRNFNIIPFPILATNPTIGFAFGFAPGITWQMGDPSNTSMSSSLLSAIYTTKQQFFFAARGTMFFPKDEYILMADIRFHDASQPTYGLGTGKRTTYLYTDNSEEGHISERKYLAGNQMMHYNWIRFHINGFKRYQDTRFFWGVSYMLDYIYNIKDHMLDLSTNPQKITQHYRYNTLKEFDVKGNVLSGLAINGMFDSRDNVINPYSGRYIFANMRFNPKFLGSAQNSSMLWLEYRDYFNLSEKRPRHLIAIWNYAWIVTSGNVPYMNLPAIGWDMFSRSGRAYTIGRFRGEDLLYSEAEYRFPLQANSETLGGVLFANLTSASSRTDNVKLLQYLDFAYGGGLRIMLNKKTRANLTIDYGRGLNGSNGLFIGLNEVF